MTPERPSEPLVRPPATADAFERMPLAFAAVDRQWRFTYLNEGAEELLARTREELVGRGMWEASPEAVGTVFWESYEHAMAARESVSFEAYYEPLGRWAEVHAVPAPDGGLYLYFRDVTQRKQHEHALR